MYFGSGLLCVCGFTSLTSLAVSLALALATYVAVVQLRIVAVEDPNFLV